MAPIVYHHIVTSYQKGVLPRVISEETGYSMTHIHRALKAEGVTRSISQSKRRISIDEAFFEKIDSHEKAQVFGFICADGCVRSTLSAIVIAIAREDHEYLEFVKRATQYAGEIKIRKSRRPNEQDLSSLTLCSVKMVRDIMALGCGPRKSLTLGFPPSSVVPDEYLASFMLGYFEGDGSLSACVRKEKTGYHDFVFTICGSEGFCRRYAEVIFQKTGVPAGVVCNRSIHMLRINGNRQIEKVMRMLYEVPGFRLSRKLAQFELLLRVNSRKGRPVPVS